MTSRYRARAKIRVTLTLIPSLVTCVIAARPSGVAGILTNRLSRSTALRSARAVSARGAAVSGQPGIDLDRDPPVPAGGPLVDRGEDVTGGADVVGGDGEDRSVHVGALLGQVTQLVVVTIALGQG